MQKSNPHPNNTRFQIRPASPEEAGLLYIENHWLSQWFSEAYGDE